MAKELFNSPRYEKKGFIPNLFDYKNNVFIWTGWLLWMLTPTIGVALYLALHSFVFFISFFIGGIVFFRVGCSDLLNKIYYHKLYIKNLNKQKELFHNDGNVPYILPYEELYHSLISLKLRLFTVVMKADKEEKVVEMDKVKTYINNHEGHNYTNRVDEFKKYLKEDFAVEDVAFAMYWWYENDREEIMKALFDLAYADGDFCEEEEYTLRYIAYHMHLNESEYERTLRKFINENSIKDGYERYQKARYKRSGGYWYHDKKGNRRWYSFKDDDDKKTGDSSSASGNNHNTTPSISPELQKAYAVLGIHVDATPSEINACKRNLLRLNHPDLMATRGQEAVNNATLKCQKINQAYELLKANGKC